MRQPSPWTPTVDYALAFASGMGFSNQQIANLLADGFTRNSVIGRRHRIGLCGSCAAPVKMLRQPLQSSSVCRTGKRGVTKANAWTQDEDDVLRGNTHLTAKDLAPLLPRRSNIAIWSRRKTLGVAGRIHRFTEWDDTIIRERWLAYTPVEDIVRELGRSTGVLEQRVFRLGLCRDNRKTRLANKFGIDVLTISDDPSEIRQVLIARQQAEEAKKQAEEDARIAMVLAAMKQAIENGGDRKIEMQTALLAGAVLQQVGDTLGITRERVRQIVCEIKAKPRVPREPRRVICRECGEPFQWGKQGKPRYCVSCKTGPVAERKRQKNCTTSRERRSTEEGRRYHREWTRRSRLKDKILQLAGTELAQVLREVAQVVGGGADDRIA